MFVEIVCESLRYNSFIKIANLQGMRNITYLVIVNIYLVALHYQIKDLNSVCNFRHNNVTDLGFILDSF